jgi:hypothetical protein
MDNERKKKAQAIVTVHTYTPKAYDMSEEGPRLTKVRIEESFSGDIEGDCVVESIQATRADGSASIVGIQRVTGRIGTRRGAFLLQVTGMVEDKVVSCDWFVISGSGTNELTGLRGEGGFRGKLGEGSQAYLNYWLET